MNLIEPILLRARRQPDAIAVIDGRREISYAELGDLVSRTAAHLDGLGLKRGNHVGICLRDGWQHIVVLLALARLGVAFVQIDPRARAAEKSRIVEAIGLEFALVESNGGDLGGCHTEVIDARWWEAIAATGPLIEGVRDWNIPFVILSSSGTTGVPKFAVATHLEFFCRIASHAELVPVGKTRRYLSASSISFSAGRAAFLAHLLRGDTCIFLPSVAAGADFVETCLRQRVSVSFAAPSLTRQLLQLAKPGELLLPDLDALISTGAPLFADEKREAMNKITGHFYELYGATGIGIMSTLRPQDISERPDSVGRPFSLVDIQIVDEGGGRAPPATPDSCAVAVRARAAVGCGVRRGKGRVSGRLALSRGNRFSGLLRICFPAWAYLGSLFQRECEDLSDGNRGGTACA